MAHTEGAVASRRDVPPTTEAPCTAGGDPPACPIAPVLQVFGSQWKHQILWHLLREEVRFNALRRRLPGITPKTLTRQLRDLERDGLVHREQFSEIPPRVVYSATPIAHSLQEVFEVLNRWGHEHMPAVERARSVYGEE